MINLDINEQSGLGGESLRFLTAVIVVSLGLFSAYFLYAFHLPNAPLADPIGNVVTYLLLGVFVALSLRTPRRVDQPRLLEWGRLSVFVLLVLFVSVLPLAAGIADRVSTGDLRASNDHALQTEAAVTFLLHGQNPYGADYRETEAARAGVLSSPGTEHYLAFPFDFLLALPFRFVTNGLAGWYDERLVHLLAFLLVLAMILFRARGERGLLVGSLFAFNPFFLLPFTQGYADAPIIALLALFGWCLARGRVSLASVCLGFAAADRQYVLLFLPLYIVFLFATTDRGQRVLNRLKTLVRPSLFFAVPFLAVVLPFFLWNPHAFVDDTLRYTSGSLASNFPVQGFGVSIALLRAHAIAGAEQPFPFWLIQVPIVTFFLVLFARWLFRQPSVGRLFVSGAAVLFAFFALSRFLHVNYVGEVISLMVVGLAFAAAPMAQNEHAST